MHVKAKLMQQLQRCVTGAGGDANGGNGKLQAAQAELVLAVLAEMAALPSVATAVLAE